MTVNLKPQPITTSANVTVTAQSGNDPMPVNSAFARAALVASTLLLVGAAPAEQVIPLPGVDGEALIIPANSPVQFSRFGTEDDAHFSGRFVLTGTYSLECDYCDESSTEKDLVLDVDPDPQLAERLPHWKIRDQDVKVYLFRTDALVRGISTSKERAEVVSHKRDDIHGRIAMVVDDFRLAIECDSSFYSARFVRIVKPLQLAQAQRDGNYGCG